MISTLITALTEKNIPFTEHKAISSISSMKVGGVADVVVQAKSEEHLVDAVRVCRDAGVRFEIVGGLTNTIFSDGEFDGVVIVALNDSFEIKDSGDVYIGAGVVTAVAAQKVSEAGFTGFEWAVGVPGRIGGAIVGNAGAMKGEIKDSCVSVRVYDAEIDEILEMSAFEVGFGYRESRFKRDRHLIVLGATFHFEPGDVVASREIMKATLAYRMTTQPKGEVSCGCMFKNYELNGTENLKDLEAKGIPAEMLAGKRIFAGFLIEKAGLKGLSHGGARVSPVHANFLTNVDHATVEDLRTLVEMVKAAIFEKFGIMLQEEVRYV